MPDSPEAVFASAKTVRSKAGRPVQFEEERVKMPKLKTKSSAKKRFRFTAKGKVLLTPAGKRHGMRKRPNKMLRDARGTALMHPSDAKKVCAYYFHV